MSRLSKGDILDRVASSESLRGVNLVRADLSAMELARVDLSGANLRMADLSNADLKEARLTGCFLSGAILSEASLVGANMVESSMIGAILRSADLSRADLSGADLTGANLQGAELVGAYLVGTYLNETDLGGADLSGAYIRMAQMSGSNLMGAILENADFSNSDLSSVNLDESSLIGANLTSANLSASTMQNCNLRGADLSGADLSACNLTGAKLADIKFTGAKLDDAWAEWVDVGIGNDENRKSLEEVFLGIVGRPIAQVLVEGRVGDDIWAVILAHLCEFQITHPNHADVRLKAIHQGMGSSALYLEADHELSLGTYLAELADILGKGALELYEKVGAAVASYGGRNGNSGGDSWSPLSVPTLPSDRTRKQPSTLQFPLGHTTVARVEELQRTPFWTSEKAVAVLTGSRQIWIEAMSNPGLTLRAPHGSAVGIDLIRGCFSTERRKKQG